MGWRLILMASLTMFSVAPQAVSQTPGSGILAGLRKVTIKVKLLNPTVGQRIGLHPDGLKSLMLVDIRRNIPVLQVIDEAPSKVTLTAEAFPLRELSGLESGIWTVILSIEVSRPVIVLSDDGNGSEAARGVGVVWEVRTAFTLPQSEASQHLRTTVEEFLTDMAADFFRQNP